LTQNISAWFCFGMKNKTLERAIATGIVPARGTTAALNLAAAASTAGATACRAWEAGGDAAVVTHTAAAAKAAASIAIESVVTDEPWDGSCSDPVTRRARLAYAAWFVLLAGIDEEGIDRDLDCAAELFYAAVMA
jgi:hypothetical protein